MKSADNHTKQKSPGWGLLLQRPCVARQDYNTTSGELLSRAKVHTALIYWLWHACMWVQNDKDTMASLMSTHKCRKLSPRTHPSALSLPLSGREGKHVSLRSHSELLSSYIYPSVHLIFQSLLSVCLSAGIMLCSPFTLWILSAHLSETDGCPSNCHSPRPPLIRSRLNTKKDNGH